MSSLNMQERARFSFMGGKGGPLWKQLTFRLSLNRFGYYILCCRFRTLWLAWSLFASVPATRASNFVAILMLKIRVARQVVCFWRMVSSAFWTRYVDKLLYSHYNSNVLKTSYFCFCTGAVIVSV